MCIFFSAKLTWQSPFQLSREIFFLDNSYFAFVAKIFLQSTIVLEMLWTSLTLIFSNYQSHFCTKIGKHKLSQKISIYRQVYMIDFSIYTLLSAKESSYRTKIVNFLCSYLVHSAQYKQIEPLESNINLKCIYYKHIQSILMNLPLHIVW